MTNYRHTRSSSPELRLLLAAIRPSTPPASIMDSARRVTDWKLFLDLCQAHAVRPLVHRSFASPDPSGVVPPEVRTSLRRFASRNQRRNTVLTLELSRLLRVFEQAAIPALAFKGPILAQHLYGSISLREFLDLDILVPPACFPEAEKILWAQGYQSARPAGGHTGYLSELGQVSFRRPGEGFGIDLHWKLGSFGLSPPFTEEELRADLQTLPLAGFAVRTLSWEHLALFLAFHGAKERWRSLKWICDFGELVIRRPELDWHRLMERTTRRGSSHELLLAAQLVDTLGFAAPAELVRAAKQHRGVQARAALTLRGLADRRPEDGPLDDIAIFLYTIQGLDQLPDRVALAGKLLTTLTVSDFNTVALPARLYWIYYLIRPLRLASKAVSMLLRRLRSRFFTKG